MFSPFWKRLFGRPARLQLLRRHYPRPLPRLEVLEDRTLLAVSVFSSNDVPRRIPELGTSGSATSTLTVTESLIIGDLDVQLDIDHTFDADLDVFLQAPNGVRIELFTDVGGAGENFDNTILDDEAGTPITSEGAPFNGRFRPEEPLNTFDGLNVQGVWTLEIVDDSFGDFGSLKAWSLIVTSGDVGDSLAEARETLLGPEGGSFSFTARIGDNPFGSDDVDLYRFEATKGQLLKATTSQPVGGSAVDTILRLLDSAGNELGLNDDAPGTRYSQIEHTFAEAGTYFVGVSSFANDVYDPTSAGSGALGFETGDYQLDLQLEPLPTVSYRSTDVPKAILDSQTITSTITILDSYRIADVNVTLDIDHDFDFDLQVFLISPSGTEVELFTDVGFFQQDFRGTTLDDEAERSITEGSGPFSGVFRPEGMLGDFDGEEVQGVWTLEITDTFFLDDGTLNDWSLTITPDASYNSTDVPKAILDSQTITSTITILDSYRIADVNVTLDIDHDFDFDLQVFLISPSGTEVELFTDVGFFQQDFRGTTLDDEADRSITEGSGPFSGVFRPEGMLGDFDGEEVQGVWTLEITDTFFLDDGTLNDWFLTFEVDPLRVADLAGISFDVVEEGVQWGDAITIDFTLGNLGAEPAGPFMAEFRLSADSSIDPLDHLLGQISIPGLAPGESVSDTLSLTLPGAPGNPPDSFLDSATVTIGLLIDPTDAVVEGDENNNSNRGVGTDLDQLAIFRGNEEEPNNTLLLANEVGLNSLVTGSIISPDDVDFFAVTISEPGRLSLRTAPVPGGPLDPRISLFGPGERLLVSSDDVAPGVPDALIVQHVLPGTYFVSVTASGQTFGAYELTNEFVTATEPAGPLPVNRFPGSVVTGDFTSDGIVDIVTANADSSGPLSFFVGLGDGTFQPEQRLLSDDRGVAVAAGDFDGDGALDVAALTGGFFVDGSVTVFLQKNGTLVAQAPVPVGRNAVDLIAGDFDGNGKEDLAVIVSPFNEEPQGVVVLLSQTTESFQLLPLELVPVEGRPVALAAGFFDDDNNLDIAVANQLDGLDVTGSIALLSGNGDGTFDPHASLPLVPAPGELIDLPIPEDLVAADLDGDGNIDLATANGFGRTISLFLGHGDGSFEPEQQFREGRQLDALVAGDLNGDGISELITANPGSDDVSVLIGGDEGALQPSRRFRVGDGPESLATGDFNQDNRLDLVVASGVDLTILLGLGDATFQGSARVTVGVSPITVTSGDYNRDGRIDLITANVGNPDSNQLSLLLGQGDGTFRSDVRIPTLDNPRAVVTDDFNSDNRPDVAVVNGNTEVVSILLGLGDGTFFPTEPVELEESPFLLASGDFTGDNISDLVVVSGSQFAILRGRGDGRFDLQPFQTVSQVISSIVTADFDGDQRLDLALTAGAVVVFLQREDGTLEEQVSLLEGSVNDLAAGDFNDDGNMDLAAGATSFLSSGNVTFLLGDGIGGFTIGSNLTLNVDSGGLTSADFNGDGRDDLAAIGFGSGSEPVAAVVVQGFNGEFDREPQFFPVGDFPIGLVAADFDNSGRDDLAVINFTSEDVSVLLAPTGIAIQELGNSGPLLEDATTRAVQTRANRPRVQDLTGDGLLDVLTLDESGRILVRFGRSDPLRLFDPPALINGGRPAKDVAIVEQGSLLVLAALDLGSDRITVYDLSGQILEFEAIGANFIKSADLNGDGLGDLVFDDLSGEGLNVLFSDQNGKYFTNPQFVLLESRPSVDVELVDVDGSSTIDLVQLNQVSGDLSIFLNQGNETFTAEQRFRAGNGPFGLFLADSSPSSGAPVVRSAAVGSSFVFEDFDEDQRLDVVVTNSGENSLALLRGKGEGAFVNPERVLTGTNPRSAVAGLFNGDAFPDLAILNVGPDEVTIFLGDGQGGFRQHISRDTTANPITISAGTSPTGLTAEDINQDGFLDILVGNALGDLLVLLGNGQGDFAPFRILAGNSVGLTTTDFNNDGLLDAIIANEASAEVLIQLRQPNSTTFTSGGVLQAAESGLLAPVGSKLADLNSDDLTDVIVPSFGSNALTVYLQQEDNSYVPRFFATGTNPVGVTVGDLNGDQILDLVVANQGSNDVSVFLGEGQGEAWNLVPGPRLNVGAGPIDIEIRDQTGDGIPDLLTTNGQDGTLVTIPGIGSNGVGTGFFDDNPDSIITSTIAPVPITQTQLIDNNLGFALTQQGSIVSFNPTTGEAATVFTPIVGREINAFQTFVTGSSTALFTANGDGSVSFLTTEQGDTFTEQVFVSDESLGSPSALEVLQLSEDRFEVYVTDAGESQPLVLTLSLRTESTPLGDNPFTPIITLMTVLSEQTPSATAPEQVPETFNPFFFSQALAFDGEAFSGDLSELADDDILLPFGAEIIATLVVFLEGGAEESEENDTEKKDEESTEEEQPPTLEQFLSGVDEALQRLGWGEDPEGKNVPEKSAEGDKAIDKKVDPPPEPSWLQRLFQGVDKPLPDKPPAPPGANVEPPATPEESVDRLVRSPKEETPSYPPDGNDKAPAVLAGEEQASVPIDPFIFPSDEDADELAGVFSWSSRPTSLAAALSSAVFASGTYAYLHHSRRGRSSLAETSEEKGRTRKVLGGRW